MRRTVRVTFLASLAFLLAGCATTRQPVPVELIGDAPARDERGRRLSASQRTAMSTIVVVAGFPCPRGSGRACADAPTRRVPVDTIVRHLGPPQSPAEVAGRMASGYPRDAARRAAIRAAYVESVRTRYRLYADHVAAALREADWVEVPDADGRTRRWRRARVDDALDAALQPFADRWAEQEWSRFEAAWARRRPSRRTQPARRSSPPPREPPAATTAPGGDTDPAPAVAAPRADTCRQGCQLRWRACLARCRTSPVEGGAYDACTYECAAADAGCRATCRSGG